MPPVLRLNLQRLSIISPHLALANVSAKVTELHIADHCAVLCTLDPNLCTKSNAQKHAVYSYRPMENLNRDALTADLAAMLWAATTDAKANVDQLLKDFNAKFLSVWNKHIPVVSRKVRKRHIS